MYGFKFTPREKIVKAKIQLQSESPFFSHLIMNMSLTEDKNIPSMGVNFKGDARYNPEWVETLTSKQLKGVLCHEVMHVALIHLLRLGKRNHRTWNIATDMMINSMISMLYYVAPMCHYSRRRKALFCFLENKMSKNSTILRVIAW